jgi:hypothetical protein
MALTRAFRQEPGADIDITGPAIVLENIYVHAGQKGHKVIFAAPIEYRDTTLIAQDALQYIEPAQADIFALWHDIDGLDTSNGPMLFAVG